MKQLLSILISTFAFNTAVMAFQDINVQKGWQLLGAVDDINVSIFDNSCVDYLWKYDIAQETAKWRVHIVNGTITSTQHLSFNSLEDSEGYWLRANSECNVSNEFLSVMYNNFNEHNSSSWQKADWSNGNPFYNGWSPEQITFDEGNLILKLEAKNSHEKSHASGEYRTFQTYKYGRYTARFQATDINGTISSFFTYTGPHEGDEWDEIDVEILGKDPTKLQLNYWRDGHEHPKFIDLGFDASEDMHTYAFVWHPEYIKWYVDGELVHTVIENNQNDNDSLPINAGKIMLNLWAAIGVDSWSGIYEDNTSAITKYDYIMFEEFKKLH